MNMSGVIGFLVAYVVIGVITLVQHIEWAGTIEVKKGSGVFMEPTPESMLSSFFIDNFLWRVIIGTLFYIGASYVF